MTRRGTYVVILRCGHDILVPAGEEWEPKWCPRCERDCMVRSAAWLADATPEAVRAILAQSESP
jgi:hypothetical protein